MPLEDLQVESKEGYDTLECALSLLDVEANEVGEFCCCFRDGVLMQKFVRMLPSVNESCNVHPIKKYSQASSIVRWLLLVRLLNLVVHSYSTLFH